MRQAWAGLVSMGVSVMGKASVSASMEALAIRDIRGIVRVMG